MNEISAKSRCPYLGLEDDPGMYCLFPTQFHRCYRGGSPKAVDANRQERYCLHASHADCPIDVAKRSAWSRRRRAMLYGVTGACIAVAALVALAQTVGNGGPVPAGIGRAACRARGE